MDQKNYFLYQIAQQILPNDTKLSEKHVEHLQLCLQFLQLTIKQDIIYLKQITNTSSISTGRCDLYMIDDNEKGILIQLCEIVIGQFDLEWSQACLGAMYEQLKLLRQKFLYPTVSNYFDQQNLLPLIQFEYFKQLCESILYLDSPKIMPENVYYFENAFIQNLACHFNNVNATKIARDLKMEEFFQFQFHNEYQVEFCLQLDQFFESTFHSFYFKPSIMFLHKLIGRTQEHQMGLINFICQAEYSANYDQYVYSPVYFLMPKQFKEVANAIIAATPYDISVLKYLQHFKRVDKKSTFGSFQSLIKQLEMKLTSLNTINGQLFNIQDLIVIMKAADARSYTHLIENLHQLLQKLNIRIQRIKREEDNNIQQQQYAQQQIYQRIEYFYQMSSGRK
ncbi:Conserved_hypothetical protein [Hexamita inflata]|uniref:Uncharacterized protein n=1 Tax=Hexamita inflata TaxID=28002 RepID=A0AA86QYP0_9EUKA|nr:Conserved hypothetical protein [Hexamita inflata]